VSKFVNLVLVLASIYIKTTLTSSLVANQVLSGPKPN